MDSRVKLGQFEAKDPELSQVGQSGGASSVVSALPPSTAVPPLDLSSNTDTSSMGGVAPGDPSTQAGDSNKTMMQQVEIATPTSRNLLQITDHVPLDPWPDELIVDEIKVSFVFRHMFSTENVISILIKDITDIVVESDPLFSALKIVSPEHPSTPPEEETSIKGPLRMRFLDKDQAAHARRLIFGLMIMNDRKVDTSKMSVEELIERAEDLGRAR